MDINWSEKLSRFAKDVSINEDVFELIHRMGSKKSARSTVYQLSKRYPEYLWSYEDDIVRVTIPQAPPLVELSRSKWRQGCRDRGKSDLSFKGEGFQGDVYSECLEEVADLYNYIHVAYEKGHIDEKSLKLLKRESQSLYNILRRSFEG